MQVFHGGGFFMGLGTPEQRPKVTWQLLRRVLRHARPYRWRLAAMLLMILTTAALGLVTPLILRDLIDNTLPRGDTARLVRLALALLLLPVVSGAINVWQRRLNASVGEGVIFDLRGALYAHLQAMSLRFFTNTKVGELMSRLNSDVIGAQNAISNTIVNIITSLVQAVALLTMMLLLEWRLTLVAVVVMPLLVVAARRMGGMLRDITRAQMEANAQMNAMMNETLNVGGALLVKLFGRAPQEVARFQARAKEVRDLGIRRAVRASIFFVLIGLVSAVGMALVYGLGGYLVIRDEFTIGTIVAFGTYLGSLYGALQGLAGAPVELATSIVSFERVFEVIDLPLEIQEQPGAAALTDVRGELRFDDVSFRYEVRSEQLLTDVKRIGQMSNVTTVLSGGTGGSSAPGGRHAGAGDGTTTGPAGPGGPPSQARATALDNISFIAQPGQLVALVGPSGAGKTTLTYLIPRLYDPTGGRILLDGHDLREVTLASLITQVGMVTQETHLFHDTIRTNLLYARLDASQAEQEAAARAANIHDFIMGLPNGYDTVVGERGYRLSGGERQRLALARVILKNPRLLVLDEATSHLDSESEALIQEALKRVMAGRTSIVIAHRLSTILAADVILVLDRGQVVERGTHAELLALDGLYARLYDNQFRREVAAA
ncbi:MAG: ABC transporter ATP-binding protein [Anaerolineales bacterium]|nr:ABC transporter ATP-binding protein [Anaerolineales bacterium]